MPVRNLRPRTAGCVSDHEDVQNRCQQPGGRVHNPTPINPVERLRRRINGYKRVVNSASEWPTNPSRIADGAVNSLGTLYLARTNAARLRNKTWPL
jgi:hypothetical protein